MRKRQEKESMQPVFTVCLYGEGNSQHRGSAQWRKSKQQSQYNVSIYCLFTVLNRSIGNIQRRCRTQCWSMQFKLARIHGKKKRNQNRTWTAYKVKTCSRQQHQLTFASVVPNNLNPVQFYKHHSHTHTHTSTLAHLFTWRRVVGIQPRVYTL